MANRAELMRIAREAARRYGVPEAGFLALINRESGWNPSARSPAGALGVAQFMPGTARGLGINPLDPRQALPASAKHLATLKKNLGSWKLALAGYNAGGGAVQRYGGVPPYRETQNYVTALLPSFQSAPPPRVAAPPARTGPAPVAPNGAVTVPDNGTINLAAALGLFDKQAEAALRGEAPSANYVNQMLALVQQGKVRATPQALPGVGPLVRPRPGATQTIPPPTVTADVTPSGGWGGTQGALEGLVKPVIDRHGLVVTSSKRDRRNTASGGVSDHWTGSTNSYAWDVGWNGSMPTPAADRAASNIVRALGGPRNWGLRGGNFTTTRNGIRWQVLYRTNVGGNHYNHVHVGARRV